MTECRTRAPDIPRPIEDPVILEIARTHNRSAAQVSSFLQAAVSLFLLYVGDNFSLKNRFNFFYIVDYSEMASTARYCCTLADAIIAAYSRKLSGDLYHHP